MQITPPPPPPPQKPRHRGRGEPPPPTVPVAPKPTVHINLNRKFMTHGIVQQLRDTAKAKEMLSGSAINELLDEYDRMRYLCEGLVTAYERNNEADVRQVIEVLRMLL